MTDRKFRRKEKKKRCAILNWVVKFSYKNMLLGNTKRLSFMKTMSQTQKHSITEAEIRHYCRITYNSSWRLTWEILSALTNTDYEDFFSNSSNNKPRYLHHFLTSMANLLSSLAEDRAICATVPLVSTTHIIMEGFRFTGVVTCLSPLWCSAIQIPEYTVDKTGYEANKSKQTTPGHICEEMKTSVLPPPGVQEPRRFSECYVFLPSYLGSGQNYPWESVKYILVLLL